MFYETVWDTKPFNSMWPEDGSQPLVLSMGDPYVLPFGASPLVHALNVLLGPVSDITAITSSDGKTTPCKELWTNALGLMDGRLTAPNSRCKPMKRWIAARLLLRLTRRSRTNVSTPSFSPDAIS